MFIDHIKPLEMLLKYQQSYERLASLYHWGNVSIFFINSKTRAESNSICKRYQLSNVAWGLKEKDFGRSRRIYSIFYYGNFREFFQFFFFFHTLVENTYSAVDNND